MDTILEVVIFQIKEACMYLPAAFRLAAAVSSAVALAGLSVCLAFRKKPTVTFMFRFVLYVIWLFAFVTYSYCVLQLTILSRTPVPWYDHVDWVFLSRWFDNNEQKSFYLANIVMFIPFGILLPMIGKPMRHILIAAPVAAACSIGIEAVQLKYHLGACQLDDVLLNTFGFLMGFLVYLALSDIYGLLSVIAKFLYRYIKIILIQKRKIVNKKPPERY